MDVNKKDLLEHLNKLYEMNEEHGTGKLIEYYLKTMITNLEKNIKIDEQRELVIHDKVKVIKIEEMDQLEYLHKEGWVVEIKDWEYPYSIQFDDGSTEWLWNRDQLELL